LKHVDWELCRFYLYLLGWARALFSQIDCLQFRFGIFFFPNNNTNLIRKENRYENNVYGRSYITEEVLSTAFELDGTRMQIFVNYNTEEKTVQWQGREITIGALSVHKEIF
jgi:hypothetical protein